MADFGALFSDFVNLWNIMSPRMHAAFYVGGAIGLIIAIGRWVEDDRKKKRDEAVIAMAEHIKKT